MASSEFQVVAALQRRKARARALAATRATDCTPVALAAPQARSTRLTRDDSDTRNIRRYDVTPVLARIAACEPPAHVAGTTDFNPAAPHATPELIRGLSVVPNVPAPTVTEDTWETNYVVQGRNGNTHARKIGDRLTLRGVASCDGRMTPEGRFAEEPTVYVFGRTVPVSRFDRKESVHLRALHENARRDNVTRNYRASRELTMREMIRANALAAAGGTQAEYD